MPTVAAAFDATSTPTRGQTFSVLDGKSAEDKFGNTRVKLGSGILFKGGKDDSFEVAESKRPSREAAPFVELIQTLMDLSRERVARGEFGLRRQLVAGG